MIPFHRSLRPAALAWLALCAANAGAQEALAPPDICLVTVDSASRKNLIVWEKTGLASGLARYRIYKETSPTKWTPIDSVDFSGAYSEYIDMNSSPGAGPSRYRISAVDSSGNESLLSAPHMAVHLSVTIGANNQVMCNWGNYEGFNFSKFRVWEGSNIGPMVMVKDSMHFSVRSWEDWTLNMNADTLFYLVEVPHPLGCTSTNKTKNYNSSRSNKSGIAPPPDEPVAVDRPEQPAGMRLFPNPAKDRVTVELDIPAGETTVTVLDARGRVVRREAAKAVSGRLVHVTGLAGLVPGVYYVRVQRGNSFYEQPVVVQE